MVYRMFGKMAGGVMLLAVLLAMPAVATAQEEEIDPVNEGAISLDAGFDVTSFYIFRGLPQENQGAIIQPWAEIGATLFESDSGPVNSVSVYGGLWNSLQDEDTFADTTGSVDIWYEADVYAGASMTLMEDWSLSVTHTSLTSPNDGFGTIHEVAGSVGYDDSGLLGDFALSPYVTIIGEYDGQADGGTDEGIYLEVGGGPSFTLIDSADYPVTLSIPLTAGFSVDDYYEGTDGDDTFGYFDIGADVSMPLSFMPGKFGSWETYAGVHFITLGDNAAAFGAPAITDGDDNFVYGTFGVSFSY